jgi:hypothetical protein
MTEDEVRAIKQRHSPQLLQQPGVSGVGVQKDEAGEYFIALHMDVDDPAVRERLPKNLEGAPVRLILSGAFRAGTPKASL